MKKFKLVAILLLVTIVGLVSLFIYSLGPKNSGDTEKRDFVVVENQKSADIAKKLETDGLIRSSFAFYLYLKIIGGKILPGTYELTSSQSGSEIASNIATGKIKVSKITIIEGWRATQMEDYFVSDKKMVQLRGFADKAKQYEGYLFPDTYEVRADITVDQLISLLRDTFNEKTKNLKITPETVILASIVEREAAADGERTDIAGVYANRVKIGMKLEADPTVQYAKGSWAALSIGETKTIISPYNTYLNIGWPPGPISSPGLKSLTAAANPANSGYLYFFHAKGQTYFSKTYAEHQAKVRQYF